MSQDSLPLDVISKANRNAQADGVIFGSLAGSVGAFLSFRFFKMSRKVSTFSGLATGIAAGYLFAKQALMENIAKARLEQTARARLDAEGPKGIWAQDRGEPARGAGLETLDDKYASTSGDH